MTRGHSTRNEPHYQGEALSEWLTLYQQGEVVFPPEAPSGERRPAQQALQAIGTNALPFLIDWMQYEPPAWRRKIGGLLPSQLRKRFFWLEVWRMGGTTDAARLANLAPYGFFILKTNALPALDDLRIMIGNTNALDTADRATGVIGLLGVDAAPAMMELLSGSDQNLNRRIVLGFWAIAHVSGIEAARPYLQQLLTNQSTVVRQEATNIIKMIERGTLTNAPAK